MEILQEETISGIELGDLLEEREKPNWEWIAGRAVQKLMAPIGILSCKANSSAGYVTGHPRVKSDPNGA